MAAAVPGVLFSRDVLEALGLPPDRVISLDIHIDARELVTVDVRLLVDEAELHEVESVLKHYVLTALEDEEV